MAFIAWLMESLTSNSGGMASALLTALYVAGILPIVALAGAAYANLSLWRAPSTWFAKIWGVFLLLSVVVIMWFAVAMNFYSFDYSY